MQTFHAMRGLGPNSQEERMSAELPHLPPGRPSVAAEVDLSVVIPVYNEEAGLPTLFARLYPALDRMRLAYEVVFVDDGSGDNSVALLAEQFSIRPDVTRVVLFNGNYGQHMAILAGFGQARGNVVVTLDADLQNPPEEIPRLVEKMREGFDYVGSIRHERHDQAWRKLASTLMNRVRESITSIRISDQGNMLRAYGRNVVDLVNQCGEVNTFVPALAYKFARRPAEIVVAHEKRAAGQSKYSLYSLIRLNFDLMTGFSVVPLQVFSMLGMALSFASALLVAVLLLRRFVLGAEAEGAFTLFAVMFFLMGVILFGIGLVGEYVGRILQQVRARPRYVVRAVLQAGSGVATSGVATSGVASSGVATPGVATPGETAQCHPCGARLHDGSR